MFVDYIPPDVSYGIDCSVILGQVSADTATFLFNIDKDVVSWYDNLERQDGSFFQNYAYGARQRYTGWRNTANPNIKGAVVWTGINSLPQLKDDSIKHVIHEACRQATTKRNVKKLLGKDSFVHKYAFPIIPITNEVGNRANEDILDIGESKFVDSINFIADIPRRDAGADFHYDLRQYLPGQNPKKERKKIIKSVSFLDKIAGPATTKAFLSKKEIMIEGKEYNFVCQRNILSSTNWMALNTRVETKDGRGISKICFYFEGMPAADQLAAFIMHVQAGHEKEIIKTGNVISTLEAYHECDLYKPKLKSKDNTVKDITLFESREDRFYREMIHDLYSYAEQIVNRNVRQTNLLKFLMRNHKYVNNREVNLLIQG